MTREYPSSSHLQEHARAALQLSKEARAESAGVLPWLHYPAAVQVLRYFHDMPRLRMEGERPQCRVLVSPPRNGKTHLLQHFAKKAAQLEGVLDYEDYERVPVVMVGFDYNESMEIRDDEAIRGRSSAFEMVTARCSSRTRFMTCRAASTLSEMATTSCGCGTARWKSASRRRRRCLRRPSGCGGALRPRGREGLRPRARHRESCLAA